MTWGAASLRAPSWRCLFRRLWFLLRAEWNWRRMGRCTKCPNRVPDKRLFCGPCQWEVNARAIAAEEQHRLRYGPLLRDPHARRSARAVGEMVCQEDPRVTERSRLCYTPMDSQWFYLPDQLAYKNSRTGEILGKEAITEGIKRGVVSFANLDYRISS
jgi:hypothetical protein